MILFLIAVKAKAAAFIIIIIMFFNTLKTAKK